jgi:hypothetical protein
MLDTNTTYEAHLKDYAIKISQYGDPYVNACFSIKVDNGTQDVWWNGSFREGKAREITLESLMVLGLSSPNMLGKLSLGARGGALDTNKTVYLKIDSEVYNDKTQYKVRFINESQIKSGMDQNDFASWAFEAGLQADFMAVATKSNRVVKETDYSKVPEASMDDVPF